jgi:hypothetical protein
MGDDDRMTVILKLDGPLVNDHRLPLSELQRVSQHLRGTLRSIGIVLTDSGPSGHGGRVKKFIEDAVDLVVVAAPKPGSFTLELEAPPDMPTDGPAEQVALLDSLGPRLGDRSVRALIQGVEALADDTEVLPAGFDRGVLKSIDAFRRTLNRGVSEIVLLAPDDPDIGVMRLDRPKLDIAKSLIQRPHRSHAVVEGALRMVDDGTLECRVETPGEAGVTCYFDQAKRDVVWDAGHGRKYVRVTGEGEFFPDEPRPRRLWATSIVVTHEALAFDPDVFWAGRTLQAMSEEQSAAPYATPDLNDPWRDDDEAAALIAAIHQE